MNQKIVSQLDAKGYFVGPVLAEESPLEPGIYLIPGGAFDKAPPKTMAEGMRYKISGASWRAEPIPTPEPEPELIPPTRQEIIVSQLAEIERSQTLQAQADALRAELASLTA